MHCWWKARWRVAEGIDSLYYFAGFADEERTRTRLKLNLFGLGYILPNEYTLERAEPKGGRQWSYPILLRSTE